MGDDMQMINHSIVSLGISAFLAAGLSSCGDSSGAQKNPAAQDNQSSAAASTPAAPKFGETSAERDQREARGLGDYWVKSDVATEHSAPGGAVVNRIYYGQKLTVYEKRGEWYRTVENGFVPRWTRATQLSDTKPPERPKYDGPAEYRDNRIAESAIPNPGQYGLTRADVDILRKGAKLVLQTRPDCTQITVADKSVRRPDTYYVTCRTGGSVENVFFTKAEALAANLE